MKTNFTSLFVGVLVLLLYTQTAPAQKNNFNDSTAETLSPVSVYALKGKPTHRSLKLTHADWVKHDAGEVLLQIPGFSSIRKSGDFGFDPVFRGFKWEQVSILNDGGLTAHAACPNRMDPPSSQVMINQVEKIEVIKGPHNFRFGPATGAVVNFKTADPVFSSQKEIFGRINIGGESNGNIFRTEGQLGMRGKNIQVSLAGSYSNGQDYRDGSGTIIPAVFNRGAINLNAAYQVKQNQVASVNITRNFARNTSFPTLMMDLLSDDTWMIQGKYQVKSANRWYSQWNTQVFTSFVDHQMGNGLRPASATMLSHVFSNTQTSGGRTEFQIKRNNQTIYLGADLKYEYANGNRTRTMITGMMAGKTFTDTLWQKASLLHTGFFGHFDKTIGKYEFTLSSRIDLVHAKPKAVSAKYAGTNTDLETVDLNPSISAGINRIFSRSFQAGLWLGRGVRSASITEKFINFLPVGLDAYEVVGNAQLRPEVNTQLDLILAYKNQYTSVQLTLFTSSVQNFISSVVDPTLKPVVSTAPGVRKFINISTARLSGFEFHWNQQAGNRIRNEFTATYTQGQNRELDQPLPEINPFEIRNKLQAELYKNRITGYISLRHSFEQNRVSAAFSEKTTAAFTVTDLGLNIKPAAKLQFTLAVQNLFNITYKEHLSRYISSTLPLNSPGRNLVIMGVYHF
ncbi:MAG: TonB-dependent receptor [Chitinophagaceae bacterium]|nr:TonB-dependent receptor [Chitinophagaceae bacterium]MCA6452213.1 TonB-dependent receptor [Chitinophagaceae bacterium]MCA6457059.1 TonB-dependent receptor [Chitinophagaceae bacterium]MCA6458375.1 TonB-dependent receptor [Chitinophagaceae bacterium]MCA6466204.1 TonB-dependent receptor [Chitinophagaceae bacterium]